MRRFLDGLYQAAAVLAAVCLIGLLITVVLSIAGRQFNFHVRGTDAYAGYLMAAAGFLALAHTLKRGEHIRVTLLLGLLRGRARHWVEVWALAAATLLAGLFAVYSVRLVWLSHELNDISTSADAAPLWIPQLPMAAGTIVLLIAFVDELVMQLLGRRKDPGADAALHNE
jgi:TRAP-type C4-dicarboxylate transport system permease small subunit